MNKKRNTILWLGLGLVVAAVSYAWRKSTAADAGLPFAAWHKVLAGQIGADEARRILAETRLRYIELLQTGPQQTQAALRKQQEKRILPLLALYQVLQEAYTQEQALEIAEMAQRRAAWVEMQPVKLLRLFPGLFPTLKSGNQHTLQKDYPPPAWKFEWLETTPDVVAFNIYNCFYLDTLRAQGAPELTPIFCKVDDWMMENLPPSIRWERTQTLGRGGALCDFRWRRVLTGPASDDKISPS